MYNSNVHGEMSPELNGLRDQRAASDGAVYLQEVMMDKKMSKTFSEEKGNFLSPVKDMTNIIRIG